MQTDALHKLIAQTDLYLLDQIMKDRYESGSKILDAGCGEGRNLHWFLQQHFKIFAVDENENCINNLRLANPGLPKNRFLVASVEKLNFKDNYFDHIISSAVLHFARNHKHFKDMLKEMVRVLKPGGTLFIRMNTRRGMESIITENKTGVYDLPDGSERYLLTTEMLQEIMRKAQLSFVEPFKTVVVDDKRSMCVLILRKD